MVFNMVGGAGGGIKLESIAITTPPDNITYLPERSLTLRGWWSRRRTPTGPP